MQNEFSERKIVEKLSSASRLQLKKQNKQTKSHLTRDRSDIMPIFKSDSWVCKRHHMRTIFRVTLTEQQAI